MTGEEALKKHDSYNFFNVKDVELDENDIQSDTESECLSSLVKIGPTGTNVADICVTLIH